MTLMRERIESDQLVKIAADWRCQACGAEHGKAHPVTGVLVFIQVVSGETRCQVCRRDPMEGLDPMENRE